MSTLLQQNFLAILFDGLPGVITTDSLGSRAWISPCPAKIPIEPPGCSEDNRSVDMGCRFARRGRGRQRPIGPHDRHDGSRKGDRMYIASQFSVFMVNKP